MSEPGTTEKDGGGPAGDATAAVGPRRGKVGLRVRLVVLAVLVGIGWGVYRVVTWDPDYVSHVYDAERMSLRGGQGLRLIGIKALPTNRPADIEGEWLGQTAADVAASYVLDRHVTIEKDVTVWDEGGWIFGYLFVERDGKRVFVNEELVRQGMAIAKPRGVNTRYRERLDAAEQEAREAQRGVWRPENKDLLEMLRRAD